MNFQDLKEQVSKQLELKRQFQLLEINLYREQLYQQFLDQVGIPVNKEGAKRC